MVPAVKAVKAVIRLLFFLREKKFFTKRKNTRARGGAQKDSKNFTAFTAFTAERNFSAPRPWLQPKEFET